MNHATPSEELHVAAGKDLHSRLEVTSCLVVTAEAFHRFLL
jgi:hypothetical protein